MAQAPPSGAGDASAAVTAETSHVSAAIVLNVAVHVGVKLDPSIAKALAPDLEYRMREVVQEAVKFMRHSKRGKLTCEDVNSALKLRNCEVRAGLS